MSGSIDEDKLRSHIEALQKEISETNRKIDEQNSAAAKMRESTARKTQLTGTVNRLVVALSALFGGISAASFVKSDFLAIVAANKVGVYALIISLSILVAYFVFSPRSRRIESTFLDIDREAKTLKDGVNIQKLDEAESYISPLAERIFLHRRSVDVPQAIDHQEKSQFARYVQSVISSLDERISLSEQKASMLLDRGTSYLRGGIYFYVATIVLWQVAIFFTGFHSHVWVGIFSCSLTFLVVEFLAAWFLKQYRSYVDSSIAYLRVRSIFNRYMLSYYAISEFSCEGDAAGDARIQILKVLEEEIKWPELKDVNSNDFNFMLESMSSFTSALEKLRGTFDKDKARASA